MSWLSLGHLIENSQVEARMKYPGWKISTKYNGEIIVPNTLYSESYYQKLHRIRIDFPGYNISPKGTARYNLYL